MTTESNLVLQALSLSAVEREELAAALWQSLIEDPAAPADPMLDPGGISLALQRDREMDAQEISPLSFEDFRRQTSGKDEA